MAVITGLISFLILIIDKLIPTFRISPTFLEELNKGILLLIKLLEGVGYFIPLNLFMICLGVMIAIDNFALATKLGLWFMKLIRG